MVIKVYVSTISFSQEVKKNQQRALMILESKNIPFVTIDISDPGQEDSKDYMNENAKPKGDNKVPMTPQIFNDADYCGDFDGLDMANECDTLGDFLKMTDEQKKDIKIGITSLGDDDKKDSQPLTNGVPTSRENSPEKKPAVVENTTEEEEVNEVPAVSEDAPAETATEEEHKEEILDGEVESGKTNEEVNEDVAANLNEETELDTSAVKKGEVEEEEEEEEEEGEEEEEDEEREDDQKASE